MATVLGTNATSVISAREEGVTLWYAVPFALTHPHIAQTRRLGLLPGNGRGEGLLHRRRPGLPLGLQPCAAGTSIVYAGGSRQRAAPTADRGVSPRSRP